MLLGLEKGGTESEPSICSPRALSCPAERLNTRTQQRWYFNCLLGFCVVALDSHSDPEAVCRLPKPALRRGGVSRAGSGEARVGPAWVQGQVHVC